MGNSICVASNYISIDAIAGKKKPKEKIVVDIPFYFKYI